MTSSKKKIFSFFIIAVCLCTCGLFYRKFFPVDRYTVIEVRSNNIYASDGSLLAFDRESYDVYLSPIKTNDPEILEKLKKQAYESVKTLITYEEFENKYSTNSRCFIGNTRKKKENSPGIEYIKKIDRIYPFGECTTAIGLYNYKKGICRGIEILARNRPVNSSIDWRAQKMLHDSLRNLEKFKPQQSFGIIVRIKTGEVIAMDYTGADNQMIPNPCFHSIFEFGSTNKVFAALLWLMKQEEEKKENLCMSYKYKLTEAIIDGRRIKDVEATPKEATVLEILKVSSNIGVLTFAKELSGRILPFWKELLLLESVDLGFTCTTNPTLNVKTKGDEMMMCLGYCFQTTMINMIRGFSAVFDEGRIKNPIFEKGEAKTIKKINTKMLENLQKIMVANAARHKVLGELKCASKTGTSDRFENGRHGPNVNTFIVCAVPGPTGEYKYICMLAMLAPNPPKLAGLTVREAIAEIAMKLKTLSPIIE